jgi:proline dehydrogenase
MSFERTFTLGEAQQLLPALNSLLQTAMRAHRRVEEIEDELQTLISHILLAGGVQVDPLHTAALKTERERCAQQLEDAVREIAASGVPLTFDSLTEPHAERTLALAGTVSAGVALPARWQRSPADAERLRDGPRRIRLVKGEWADPQGDVPDIAEAYLDLARTLAGRKATVGVASHNPALAEAALRILLEAGTPCELEQLRGLPRRRTMSVAKKLGVPVRLYYPFGPGWWPYAVDKALARPYLPLWALRDALGVR